MAPPHTPHDVLTVPALDFQPLRLGLDDALPVSMVLLLGYGRRLEPAALRTGLAAALRAFPHLTARLHLDLQPLRAELVPGGRAAEIEWIRDGDPLPLPAPGRTALQALETLDQETLFARYAPSAAMASRSPLLALQAPMLQLRLTWPADSEACVLGVMASHMVLDGTGLALFLSHLSAALVGSQAPPVIHDRACTFPASAPPDATLPPHYREAQALSLAMAQDQDPLAASPATVFSIPVAGLDRQLADRSMAEARLFLAARLSGEVAALQPARRTLALWCNTRGLGQVPRHYTGNTGCYVHMPLEPDDPRGAYAHLKRSISRAGFAGIADTHARLKALEAAGRYVFWNGPGEALLSLNLVPHVRGAADFGMGAPEYAQLLTRNVSGLRLFTSPDGSRLVVEASLPPAHGSALMDSCRRQGLPVEAWHASGSFRPSA